MHSVDEDAMRERMEMGRSTPEGSVGSKGHDRNGSADYSRYDVRSPRYDEYSSKSPGYALNGNQYPPTGYDNNKNKAATQYQAPSSKSPGTWSTKSAGLPPTSAGAFKYPDMPPNYDHLAQRNAYSEKPARDFQGRSGYSEPRHLDFTQGKTNPNQYQQKYEPSGAYIDKTDTVV